MTKTLYTYEFDMPTVAIIRKGAETYSIKTNTEYRFKQIQEITAEDLAWCDIVNMIRPNDPYSAHLAKRAQEAGKIVISYYDDDLYNLPVSVPNPFWRKKSIRKALAYSNMVSSSSRYICEKYIKYTLGKRSYTGDAVVDSTDIKRIPKMESATVPAEKVKLIYAANPSHVAFFNQYILPIMPQLCQKYAGKISMTFMGVRPDLQEFESQIEITYHTTMPLDEYREKIKSGAFDIGLSPLPTDEFTKCKYFNKFIEYTMAGIVGVYSDTEPYTYVVKHEHNGFLAKSDPADWYECLCKAIDDALLRNQCICAAQDLLLREFTQEASLRRQNEAVPELLAYQSEKKTVGSLQPYKMLHSWLPVIERIYQVFFYWRRTGISGVIDKIKVHFRDGKAYSK